MTTKDIVISIFEIACAALLLYGVWHKDQLIRFEDRLILIVKALWRSRKAVRAVSSARAGQITRTKPKQQYKVVCSDARKSHRKAKIGRNDWK